MIVYKITNIVNGKCYIGQTIVSLEKRMKNHFFRSKNKMHLPLYTAINKYGKDNFTVEILKECSSLEELNQSEIDFIKTYNSLDRNFGYNLQKGGKNCFLSDKTKRKISISQKGRKADPILIEKMRQANLGKTTSLLQKIKVAESNRNRVHSKETRKKLSLGRLGKKHSEETKFKISVTKKNKFLGNIKPPQQ